MYCKCPTEYTELTTAGNIKPALQSISPNMELLLDCFIEYRVGIVHCSNCSAYLGVKYFKKGVLLQLEILPIDEKVWQYIKEKSQIRLKLGHEGPISFMPYLRELGQQ